MKKRRLAKRRPTPQVAPAVPRMLRLEQKTGDGEWVGGLYLNLSEATGADVLTFLAEVLDVIVRDGAALERMANAEGRTTLHPLFGGVGSIAIDRRWPSRR